MNIGGAVAEDPTRRRMRRQPPPDIDRFSDLPDPVVYLIFSCLYTYDLYRLSTVSKKWRAMVKSLPYMIFDINNFIYRPEREEQVRLSIAHEKFKHFITWVFASQEQDQELQRLSINALNFNGEHQIQQWITLSINRGLKELNLTLNSQCFFEIPISLLKSKTLEVFKLVFKRDCYIRIPNINLDGILPNLKLLELVNVMLPNELPCRRFISNCLELEDLIMVGCNFTGMEQLVISLMNLKNLIIVSYGLIYTRLVVRCPMLETFIFHGFSPKDMDFESSSSLKNVAVNPMIADDDILIVDDLLKVIIGVFDGVQETKSLTLGSMFAEFFVPIITLRLFHYPFKNLTNLKWTMNMGDIQSLVPMLKACPKLQHLSLRFERKRCDFANCDEELPKVLLDCLMYTLLTVEIYNMEGHYNQFEVIEFLLQSCFIIKTLTLIWAEGTCDKAKQEMTWKVAVLPATSLGIKMRAFDNTDA